MQTDLKQNIATHRLFFALWPSEAFRQQIDERVRPLLSGRNARLIPPANFHVTLAFLGLVTDESFQDIMDAASGIDCQSFELTFDHVETWGSAHLVCLAIDPTPAPLAKLVDRLRVCLSARHVEPDRKDFKAHVTLARDWHEKSLDERIDPLIWMANEFVLVESRPGHAGSEYTVLKSWPLAAQSTD